MAFRFGFGLEDRAPPPPLPKADRSSADPCGGAIAADRRRNDERTDANSKYDAPLVFLDSFPVLLSASETASSMEQISVPVGGGEKCSASAMGLEPLKRTNANANGGRGPKHSGALSSNEMPPAGTDLIPGVYGGGLKVWECSLDLCRHLASEIADLRRREVVGESHGETGGGGAATPNDCQAALGGNGKVLELGCGHGLPGCLLLREFFERRRRKVRSASVDEMNDHSDDDGFAMLFADYNEFVLRDVTAPNVVLNGVAAAAEGGADIIGNEKEQLKRMRESAVRSLALRVSMASGDWMGLSDKVTEQAGRGRSRLPTDGRFDVVLASETMYTTELSLQTTHLLSRHLKPLTGVGLIATKRYYFGVGGGSDAFREVASSIDPVFIPDNERSLEGFQGDANKSMQNFRLAVETFQVYDNGCGNIRELLRVRLVPS